MNKIAICFGRFNPPHIGHLSVWKMAKDHDNYLIGTNPNTSGKKDPLSFEQKMGIVKQIAPDIVIMPHKSWFTLATEAYSQHPLSELVIITDEDWVVDGINRYNGVKSDHGYYNFSKISHKRSPRMTSATKIRNAVLNNDIQEFRKANGLAELIDQAQYFDLVMSTMAKYHHYETIPH